MDSRQALESTKGFMQSYIITMLDEDEIRTFLGNGFDVKEVYRSYYGAKRFHIKKKS